MAVDLSDILGQHTFVGIVDLDKCLSLVQYSTKLYLVNHASLGYFDRSLSFTSNANLIFSEELFYQLGLRQFGDMQKIKLQPPPSLKTLISIAVEAEEIPDGASNLTKPDIVQVRIIPSVDSSIFKDFILFSESLIYSSLGARCCKNTSR